MADERLWSAMPAAVANMQREIEMLRAQLQESKNAQADCYSWIHECACAFEAVRSAVEQAAKKIPVPFLTYEDNQEGR